MFSAVPVLGTKPGSAGTARGRVSTPPRARSRSAAKRVLAFLRVHSVTFPMGLGGDVLTGHGSERCRLPR